MRLAPSALRAEPTPATGSRNAAPTGHSQQRSYASTWITAGAVEGSNKLLSQARDQNPPSTPYQGNRTRPTQPPSSTQAVCLDALLIQSPGFERSRGCPPALQTAALFCADLLVPFAQQALALFG